MSRAAREAIATALEDEYGGDWAIYAAPPDTVSAPAIVVGARTPYRVRVAACGWQSRLRLTFYVPANAGPLAMDDLDAALDRLPGALDAIDTPQVWLDEISAIGSPEEQGGPSFIVATAELDVTL